MACTTTGASRRAACARCSSAQGLRWRRWVRGATATAWSRTSTAGSPTGLGTRSTTSPTSPSRCGRLPGIAGRPPGRLRDPVSAADLEIDPYLNDPTRWATSMAHHAALMPPCLDAAGARSVVEVGAFAGDLTRLLMRWAERSGARVTAVDPSPQEGLERLAEEHA